MVKNKKIRIVFCGGGTGGHIMPIVSIAREIKNLDTQSIIELHYIGPKDKQSFEIFWSENIKTHPIFSGKIRRYFSLLNIRDILFGIPFGFLQSFFILFFMNGRLVFSKGGSGSVAVSYAAKSLGIPVFLHESDAAPGLSNRKISRFAKKIFISFPITDFFDPQKTIFVGNPIRKTLLEGQKDKGIEMFNLKSSNPVLLIIGGSQGAQAINEFILLSLNNLLKNYEIIHVVGTANYGRVNIQSKFVTIPSLQTYYHPYGSLNENELKNAYAVADLVVSRSGASGIFEIAASGKPSILIPLPTAASDHQSKNAYQYAKTGAAIVIEQDNLTENLFLQKIRILIAKSQEINQKALQFAKLDAAENIAQAMLDYLSNEIKSITKTT